MISTKCEVKGCNKVIEGYTVKQTDYLMLQHILSKHRINKVVEKVNT